MSSGLLIDTSEGMFGAFPDISHGMKGWPSPVSAVMEEKLIAPKSAQAAWVRCWKAKRTTFVGTDGDVYAVAFCADFSSPHPPNRCGARPVQPGLTRNRLPSCGFAARCSAVIVNRAEVM